MADDWAAFNPEAAPADQWAAFKPEAAPQQQAGPDAVPEAFLSRVRAGQALSRIAAAAGKEAGEGWGDSTATGMSHETMSHLIDMGIFHDPAKGRPGPVQFANEAIILPAAKLWDTITRGLNAGVHGAGGAVGQIVEEFGGSQGEANRAKNEIINAGNWAMIEGGMGRFSRPTVEPGGVADRAIGGMPVAEDFVNGGKVLESPHAEANLRRAWQEDGIHPAEAVHDAQTDAFVKGDLTAKHEPVKIDAADAEVLTETGGPLHSLSAAAVEPEPVPLDVQPASPPGRLAASFQQTADRLFDMGRDAQMLVAPMARGTTDSIAMVKDFANALRRNRWDWSRIDGDILKRFTPEQRTRMWEAADEESVTRQLGDETSRTEYPGLKTLPAEERAAVEEMQTRAQNAWLRARDLGLVEGEGLPAYTPRMVINVGSALAEDKALPLNVIGQNLKTRTAQMLHRKHLLASETEAAAKSKAGMNAALGLKTLDEIKAAEDAVQLVRDIRVLPLATSKLEDAVAGRSLINNIKAYGDRTGAETVSEGSIPAGTDTKWFTLDHPAFKTWRPKFKDGAAVKDAEGNTIFEQVPLYVHGDFEGPLRAVLNHKSSEIYKGLMSLKGKTMSLIMNSPMIHNAVEWGRALPAMPGKVVSFKVYFEGNRAKNNVPLMQEAIDNGLVPIGHRFFNQDITSMMETPDLAPGRSWTSKILAAVPGLFDEAAGVAVKRSIDKAGDFWHNTLLWDRVADLQMGLYKNFLDDAVAKGIDRSTASRMAAHWANRYAGSLPKEAMSDGATKVANMMMFSRSFTMGNLGVLKDMFTGLPKDVLAQIERDAGFKAGSISEAGDLASPQVDAVSYAKTMARRKAMAVIAMDMGLFYVGNSIMQSALNVMFNDSTLDKELHGYAERFLAKLQAVREHPLQLIQPLGLLESLSATNENEPGRRDRLHIGNTADGTAIYARNPAGKIGEEFLGYMTGPLDMMRKKLGTLARPVWQVMNNDAGFGRKVYDPDADTPAKYLSNLWRIAYHIAASQFPTGQLAAFSDLVKGEGDKKVNAAQAFGPFLGVTFSKGAPGGPAVGEMYAARAQHDFAVQNALPDIRRQIQRGDVPGAQQRMDDLGIPSGLQRFYIRTTLNPATRLSSRALRDFYQYATPEQRDRMERAQQAMPAQ